MMLLRKCMLVLAFLAISVFPLMGCTPSADNSDGNGDSSSSSDSDTDAGSDDKTDDDGKSDDGKSDDETGNTTNTD